MEISIEIQKAIVQRRVDTGEGTSYDKDFLSGKITLKEWKEKEANKVSNERLKKVIKKERDTQLLTDKWNKAWSKEEEKLKEEGVLNTDSNKSEKLLLIGLGLIILTTTILYFKNKK